MLWWPPGTYGTTVGTTVQQWADFTFFVSSDWINAKIVGVHRTSTQTSNQIKWTCMEMWFWIQWNQSLTLNDWWKNNWKLVHSTTNQGQAISKGIGVEPKFTSVLCPYSHILSLNVCLPTLTFATFQEWSTMTTCPTPAQMEPFLLHIFKLKEKEVCVHDFLLCSWKGCRLQGITLIAWCLIQTIFICFIFKGRMSNRSWEVARSSSPHSSSPGKTSHPGKMATFSLIVEKSHRIPWDNFVFFLSTDLVACFVGVVMTAMTVWQWRQKSWMTTHCAINTRKRSANKARRVTHWGLCLSSLASQENMIDIFLFSNWFRETINSLKNNDPFSHWCKMEEGGK